MWFDVMAKIKEETAGKSLQKQLVPTTQEPLYLDTIGKYVDMMAKRNDRQKQRVPTPEPLSQQEWLCMQDSRRFPPSSLNSKKM